MNTENLLKEIETKKQEIIETIPLNETKILNKFYETDALSLFFLLILSCSIILSSINSGFAGVSISMMSTFLIPMIPLHFSELNIKKNMSFSYHLFSFFRKTKINGMVLSRKRKIASEKQLDKDFLTTISLHMEKSEFKKFLKKCDGEVTLEKLEEKVLLEIKHKKKSENIEKLTDAIYEEHHNLLLEEKEGVK